MIMIDRVMTKEAFAAAIKIQRKSLQYSADELAVYAGVCSATISAIETAERAVKLDTAIKVCAALGMALPTKQPPPVVVGSVGESIRARRQELGLTQRDLARQVGLTHPSIVNIEKGRGSRKPVMSQVFQALDMDPDTLQPVVHPESGTGSRMGIRVSAEEYNLITQAARDRGITRSGFIRWAVRKELGLTK